jgi:hypothetical protein
MASLIKVDEMEANTAPLMKFNTAAYNKTEDVGLTWSPEQFPVGRLPATGGTLTPTAPSAAGIYMTLVYPVTATPWVLGATMLNCEVVDSASEEVHRVYYSANNVWNDA